jgi:hypothetical protein
VSISERLRATAASFGECALTRKLKGATTEIDRLEHELACRCAENDEQDTQIDRLTAEVARLKRLLRYVAYQRLPLGDTVFDHLDFERQKELAAAIKDSP